MLRHLKDNIGCVTYPNCQNIAVKPRNLHFIYETYYSRFLTKAFSDFIMTFHMPADEYNNYLKQIVKMDIWQIKTHILDVFNINIYKNNKYIVHGCK